MAPGRRAAVLVVDDNIDAADLLGDALEAFGYEARVAHSGMEALDAVATFTPEVALLDIGLPVIDGYDLARELRERLPALRLVAITGYGQGNDRARAFDAGFSAHLVKPVSIADLDRVVRELLAGNAPSGE
jgi:CheY-like chemotaxis protein